jgi:CheY-like chemotaxis protein
VSENRCGGLIPSETTCDQAKIAAVTASAFASERERVLASGMNDFLRKPYRAEEVFDCLTRHLGVR